MRGVRRSNRKGDDWLLEILRKGGANDTDAGQVLREGASGRTSREEHRGNAGK